jgi:tetratricopeptide (TPR) repeat protein
MLSGAPPAIATTAADLESLVQQGKADEAIDKGRAAVLAKPDDVDLRLALSRSLAAKARRFNHVVNVKLTQEDLDKGQVKVPGANLGDSPLQVGYDAALFEEALLNLDEGLKRSPKREDLHVFKCFLLTDAARIDRAKKAIDAALAALPRTPAVAKTMAAFAAERTKRNDPEGGERLLAPVAAAFPRDGAVLLDYGNILTRLGRKQEADRAFDRATLVAPADVRFQRTRALSAMLLRDFNRAQTAFDATYRLSKDPQDRFASFAAAYGIDPKESVAFMNQLSVPSASVNAAESELAHAFALAGNKGATSEQAQSLARRLVKDKQLVLAIPVLDRALKADPKLTEMKGLLASVYGSLGCEKLAK